MVLKLYGHPHATCTQRVGFVLNEKEVPFELVVVDLKKGEQKLPAHLKHQPFGQIPYIDDDGFILYESRAICRYISEKYAHQGTSLLPVGSDLKAKALFEQAASIETFSFDPYATKIVVEGVFKPLYGQTTDPAVVDANAKLLEQKLDVYEKILSKQKYLAGDEFTLADLFHVPWGAKLPAAGIHAIEERPNVARWFKSISDRPAWQAIKDGVMSTVTE